MNMLEKLRQQMQAINRTQCDKLRGVAKNQSSCPLSSRAMLTRLRPQQAAFTFEVIV